VIIINLTELAMTPSEVKGTIPQANDGYGCACGYIAPTLKEFRRHLFTLGRKEKGKHKSLGRVNRTTGEITMPPYLERTPEQLAITRHGFRGDGKDGGSPPKKGHKSNQQAQVTDILANASEVRFIPRVYTVDYSPILRGAQEAAHRVWGWRPDMPLGNFLDTVVYNFFKEHGITLAAYIVEEEEEKHGS
jgi:hypothetical protein